MHECSKVDFPFVLLCFLYDLFFSSSRCACARPESFRVFFPLQTTPNFRTINDLDSTFLDECGSPLDVQGRHHLKSRAQVHEHCSGSNRSPCNRSARLAFHSTTVSNWLRTSPFGALTQPSVEHAPMPRPRTWPFCKLRVYRRPHLVVVGDGWSHWSQGNFPVTKSNRNHLPTFHWKRDKARTPRDKIKNRYSGFKKKTASGQIRNVFSVVNVCYCNCFVFCRVFFWIDHVLLVAPPLLLGVCCRPQRCIYLEDGRPPWQGRSEASGLRKSSHSSIFGQGEGKVRTSGSPAPG